LTNDEGVQLIWITVAVFRDWSKALINKAQIIDGTDVIFCFRLHKVNINEYKSSDTASLGIDMKAQTHQPTPTQTHMTCDGMSLASPWEKCHMWKLEQGSRAHGNAWDISSIRGRNSMSIGMTKGEKSSFSSYETLYTVGF
jgi:hypothetical protein